MNTELLKSFIDLNNQKKGLNEELDRVKTNIDELEEKILEEFAEAGISSIKAFGANVFIAPQLFVSPKDGDRPRLIAALKNTGLNEFVQENFNTNTLKAYVKEQRNNGFELPQELEDAMKITETFELRIRKA
ncbi:MAG TPA: hypothetical protein PKW59_11525 [Thermotogota bacterium]|nr:hypothetical protein [Thermotogota bacterium]HPM21802.1 hypothetical protein [Thermotogota bacterium]